MALIVIGLRRMKNVVIRALTALQIAAGTPIIRHLSELQANGKKSAIGASLPSGGRRWRKTS